MLQNLDRETLHNWLIALRAPQVGRAVLLQALEAGGISKLFRRSSQLSAAAREYLANPDDKLLQSDLEWLADSQHHLLTYDHPDYPALLKRIPDPPIALWLAGDPNLLFQPQIAIIGSRNPTRGGLDNASAFASYLSQQGLLVVSGLASGIDAAGHEAALRVSSTIAVLGSGADVIYPASNRQLSNKIASNGLLVTEFPPGTAAKASHFPSRNRIISGLSMGVLVVEAGIKSGTLITARLATEQGRDVFAIPGSIHNPMSKGCHRLIKEGAKLVETGADVLQELGPVAAEIAATLHQRLQTTSISALDSSSKNISHEGMELLEDQEYQQIWANLSFDPQSVEKIIRLSGLTPQAVSSMLLMLELKGMVQTHPGGTFSRLQ